MHISLRSSLIVLTVILGIFFCIGIFFLIQNIEHKSTEFSFRSLVSSSNDESSIIFPEGSTSTDSLSEKKLLPGNFFAGIISAILPAQDEKNAEQVLPSNQEVEIDASIFRENIGSGWQNNSWGVKYSVETSTEVNGNYILVSYGKPWDGLSFYSKGFLVSGYNEIILKVNFREATATDVYVSLYNTKQKLESVALKKYLHVVGILPNTWYEIHIPLADFSLVNPLVTQLAIESGKVDTLAFANIHFALNNETPSSQMGGVVVPSKEATSTSTQVPISSGAILRSNPFLSGWTMDTWESEITEVPDSGGTMRMQFFKPWGTLLFKNKQNLDISTADTILFSLSDDADSNAKLYVIAYNPDGEKLGTVFLNDFIPSKKIPVHVYQDVFLPLLKLNPTGKSIGRIDVQAEESTGVILLKKVAFVRLSETPHGTVSSSQIYIGGFRNDWSYDTNGVIANPGSEKHSFSGDHSIQLNFTSPWSSFLILHPSGFSTRGYQSLSFMVYGGEVGGQELYLTAFDKEGKKLGTKYLSVNTSNGRIPERVWSNVTVGLSEVNASDIVLGSLKLESASPTEDVWVDDMKFLEN